MSILQVKRYLPKYERYSLKFFLLDHLLCGNDFCSFGSCLGKDVIQSHWIFSWICVRVSRVSKSDTGLIVYALFEQSDEW